MALFVFEWKFKFKFQGQGLRSTAEDAGEIEIGPLTLVF
jgi:hypothetical protein